MLPFARQFLQRRLIHASRSLNAVCTNCHQQLLSPVPACKQCDHIALLPSATTYHEIFEIPTEPNPMKVDVKDLQNKFRRGQAVCHPDTWASKGEMKQNIAQELSARLNEAYQTLSNPLARVEYLLSLHHLPLGEEEKIHDMEFMMEIMEARETIDDAVKGDLERIQRVREENQAQIVDTTKEIEDLVATKEWPKVKEGAIRLRCTLTIPLDTPIIGIGDHRIKQEAEKLAALSAVYQLHALGILDNPKLVRTRATSQHSIQLSDGTIVDSEVARGFMGFYCRKYGFGNPDITFNELPNRWEAIMTVGGRRIGLGNGPRKLDAQKACYLDVTKYLEECDPELWQSFVEAQKTGADLGLAPKVFFQMSDSLDDQLRDLCGSLAGSELYNNRPSANPSQVVDASSVRTRRRPRPPSDFWHETKSRVLAERHQKYLKDPAMQEMVSTRLALPVYTKARELLKHINDNDVTICMAATGSGKTTQIPQMILNSFIEKGKGSRCNIICTQPRRLAAVSVADRVAKERGETVGESVGFQVRFEHKHPEEHGSITFCTIGVFLRRMHSTLAQNNPELDNITHIVVDEVHERDVDTDLLLVVLKRLMADRKAKGKPLKVILMSATIDPTLFQTYFADGAGNPAPAIDIPGRSFPVTQSYLEEFLPKIVAGPEKWVLSDEDSARYIAKELGPSGLAKIGLSGLMNMDGLDREIDLSHPLIAATISHILRKTADGHVLVFLPGWDDILSVQRVLEEPRHPFGVNFSDKSQFSIHLLHSTIPLAEQQVIFTPPPRGVRRIILATNIAETSVTIPDVVYVVDSAKVKELQYDPVRRITSLVSAWVGLSNLRQRAGRAGRHRPGEYFGLLGRQHVESLQPYQTVEMKRTDLSSVVMHIKALDFPGMQVEEVLAATIEPPLPERVELAIEDLHMAGALDSQNNLTSLGQVLLSLPVDARMGRLVLYGCFFRCLDSALTLAALLSEREPFVSPLHLGTEAVAKKTTWATDNFRSDTIAALRAYNAWAAMQSRGEYAAANRFCTENFLSKPTLLTIHKTRKQILQALYQSGVIEVSAGGNVGRLTEGGIPVELNTNADSLPLLAGLLVIASQPKFAVRTGPRTYRTSNERITVMHPKSVNHIKKDNFDLYMDAKQLFAFAEKRRNVSVPGASTQTYLVNTTRLDPLGYLLFGANKIRTVENGIECDGWLPVVGNLDALEDIQRLKNLMEECMLRVFQGITTHRHQLKQRLGIRADETETESDDEDQGNHALSRNEIRELDLMTHDIVRILNNYNDEHPVRSKDSRSRAQSSSSHGSVRSLSHFETPVFGNMTSSKRSRRF